VEVHSHLVCLRHVKSVNGYDLHRGVTELIWEFQSSTFRGSEGYVGMYNIQRLFLRVVFNVNTGVQCH
jgi:hypothetical protein